MRRRTFLQLLLAATMQDRLLAAAGENKMDDAADILAKAVEQGQIRSAVMHVATPRATFVRTFGNVKSPDAMFLLGSISKPICVTAMMTLFDQAKFRLDDPVKKYIPKFAGGGRDQVTVKHLLTHTSGLADQLPENNTLRKNHASLDEFAAHASAMPLSFAAGTRYQYSSMGILLATQIAQQLTSLSIHELVERAVFRPLKMEHSALGLGRFALE